MSKKKKKKNFIFRNTVTEKQEKMTNQELHKYFHENFSKDWFKEYIVKHNCIKFNHFKQHIQDMKKINIRIYEIEKL